MTKPTLTASDSRTQAITLYVLISEETLAAVSYLTLEPNGTYYVKNDSIGKMDDPSFRDYINKLTGADRASKEPKEKKPVVYEIDEELFDRVCTSYDSTGSIKKTAKDVGVSEQKARKILITKGKYTCENHQQIIKMQADGKSLEEIGEALHISRGQLLSYLPYTI